MIQLLACIVLTPLPINIPQMTERNQDPTIHFQQHTNTTRHIFVVLPESHYGTNIGNWLKFGHVVSVEPLAIRYNTVILELLPQSHEVRPHFTKIWTYLNAK